MQAELAKLKEKFNTHKICKDQNKILPSSVSPNVSYSIPEKFGGAGTHPVFLFVISCLVCSGELDQTVKITYWEEWCGKKRRVSKCGECVTIRTE
jgi:hypothetical protein